MITEGVDAAESTSTSYRISVGDTFRGTLSNSSDEDWIAVTLTAGETYAISMTGITLSDPFLSLYDSSGTQLLAFNDDFAGLNSQITFTATTTGTYYIEADAYSTETGTYDVRIVEVAPPQPASLATLDELALYLTEGYWGTEITFNTSFSNRITVNLSRLTPEGQQLARWAMEAWEAVVDIDFVEVATGEMLTFDDNDSGAYAFAPGGRRPDGVEINIATDWLDFNGTTIDSYSFQTYVHEIGHAIGLGHQGNYNGNARYAMDATFLNDSWQVSVMSYFNQNENTTINASFGYTAGPMMADILAIQNLYGAPGAGSATAGDTVYGRGSNLGNYMDQVFAWMATGTTTARVTGSPMVFTIYDHSGNDLLDFTYLTVGARLDMRAEQFSDIGTQIGAMGIARGTVIENASTGSGNDTITGNDAANAINSGAGNDSVNSGNGNDTVNGGVGNDSLFGGAGNDRMEGGVGADLLEGEIGFDTLNGGDGNDTLMGGDGADSLYGDAGNDRIEGGQGFDQLYGGIGSDSLFGGETADRVFGGAGNDFISGGSNFGITVDGLYGEDGDDTIFGDGGFDLLDGGAGNDFLDGGDQADNLFGGAGNDTLYGGSGLDRLFAGEGNDLLFGGVGNDGLFGDAGNDTMNGEDGDDRFFGGSGNDLMFGGAGNDTINGGSGFDTITGGTGDDLMFGRFNADTFVFSNGHGNDTIGDFAAGNQFERIDLSAVSAISDLSDLQIGNPNGGAATQVGSDVVIDTGGGNSITLLNVSLADLDATNFIF
ncbi:M10 family metallopeptidase [Jannaschia pohangensis]|nr:M10 family metallopeptidase [Jannaschia pohangensis]